MSNYKIMNKAHDRLFRITCPKVILQYTPDVLMQITRQHFTKESSSMPIEDLLRLTEYPAHLKLNKSGYSALIKEWQESWLDGYLSAKSCLKNICIRAESAGELMEALPEDFCSNFYAYNTAATYYTYKNQLVFSLDNYLKSDVGQKELAGLKAIILMEMINV